MVLVFSILSKCKKSIEVLGIFRFSPQYWYWVLNTSRRVLVHTLLLVYLSKFNSSLMKPTYQCKNFPEAEKIEPYFGQFHIVQRITFAKNTQKNYVNLLTQTYSAFVPEWNVQEVRRTVVLPLKESSIGFIWHLKIVTVQITLRRRFGGYQICQQFQQVLC